MDLKRCTNILKKEYDNTDIAISLLSSLKKFTQFFFKIMNGRELAYSNPPGRRSHFEVMDECFTGITINLNVKVYIGIPVGYGKSTRVIYFIAWAMARWPDSHHIYVSYNLELAATHTETIRRIMQTPEYRELFGVEIRHDARGKQKFQTTKGGVVAAAGFGGTITGLNAGLFNLNRYSGALIIDDAHKPREVHSETKRQSVIRDYQQTLAQRPRGINVPTIMIAQRLHEADLPAFLLNGGDGHYWDRVIMPALDVHDNPLCPEKDTKESLQIKRDTDIYTFASQYQQDPQPAGGALYKREMFPILDEEPKFLVTFITADTAETSKSYNDATVFSFWGLYRVVTMGHETQEYGLHWIDMREIRVEPKQLEDEFMSFWSSCQHHSLPPNIAAIEKKSTGVTLLSILGGLRGLEIRNIERNVLSGSKSQRFLWLQPYVAKKLITFSAGARHAEVCIKQAEKITANNTHAFDDIIDTLYDAVNIGLMDKTLVNQYRDSAISDEIKSIGNQITSDMFARDAVYGHDSYSNLDY